MAKDHLALLRQRSEKVRRDTERREAEQAKKKAQAAEWDAAWQAAVQSCIYGDQFPGLVPDLTSFIELARLLKRRGYAVWLPEMADAIAGVIDDLGQYRPGQLFIVHLLITAAKPRATVKQLQRDYESLSNPADAPMQWRSRATEDIREFLVRRIENANEQRAKNQAAEARESEHRRIALLMKAAKRRPAINKQVFAVYWSDQGLTPAAIRDKWNELQTNQADRLERGDPGRDDIKKATDRGREFIADNSTTVDEMASILKLRFT